MSVISSIESGLTFIALLLDNRSLIRRVEYLSKTKICEEEQNIPWEALAIPTLQKMIAIPRGPE